MTAMQRSRTCFRRHSVQASVLVPLFCIVLPLSLGAPTFTPTYMSDILTEFKPPYILPFVGNASSRNDSVFSHFGFEAPTWFGCSDPAGQIRVNSRAFMSIDHFRCDLSLRAATGTSTVRMTNSDFVSYVQHAEDPGNAISKWDSIEVFGAAETFSAHEYARITVSAQVFALGSSASPYTVDTTIVFPAVTSNGCDIMPHQKKGTVCASATSLALRLVRTSAAPPSAQPANEQVNILHARLDLKRKLCETFDICSNFKVGSLVMSSLGPSPALLFGLYSTSTSEGLRFSRSVAASPTVRPNSTAPITLPPVGENVFGPVMIAVVTIIAVLAAAGLAFFFYKMYMLNKRRLIRPTATPPSRPKSKSSTKKSESNQPLPREDTIPKKTAVTAKRSDEHNDLHSLFSTVSTSFHRLEPSQKSQLCMEASQQLSKKEKNAVAKFLSLLAVSTDPSASPRSPEIVQQAASSPSFLQTFGEENDMNPQTPPKRRVSQDTEKRMLTVATPRSEKSTPRSPRSLPSPSTRLKNDFQAQIDTIDLTMLKSKPPTPSAISDFTRTASSVKKTVSKKLAKTFSKRQPRPPASIHISGLTSLDPFTGEAVADPSVVSVMFPHAFGVPNGYSFLQPNYVPPHETASTVSSSSSAELPVRLPPSASLEASDFSMPSYMNDRDQENTVHLVGTGRAHSVEGSSEAFDFDVTESESDYELTRRDQNSASIESSASSDEADNSIGFGSSSEDEPPKLAENRRKLTVALPVISVDHLWSPRATGSSDSATPVGTCYNCRKKDANAVLEPCRHGGLCIACARQVAKLAKAKCTICQSLIISVTQIL